MKVLSKVFKLGFVLFFLSIVSCSDDSDTPSLVPTVKIVSDSNLGNIIVDEFGNTLYFFSEDVGGNATCENGCLAKWPVFYQENLVVGAGLDEAKFTTVTRGDGTKQIAYDGWPMYYFADDLNAGDTNGESVGNKWFVAKADYSIMYALAQLVGDDGKNYTSDYVEGIESTFYLTDGNGRTLYGFTKDSNNTNSFTNSDFSNNDIWPIVEMVNLSSIPSILDKSDFGSIDVHGRKQLTYKGWPLYYFGSDNNKRGLTRGVSVPSPGIWPILNANSTGL